MAEDQQESSWRVLPAAIVAGVWLVFMARGLSEILIPPLAALVVIFVLLPYRGTAWAARTMAAAGALASIWLLSKVQAILWVTGLGLLLAYLLNPLVLWLERRGVRRSRAALYLLLPAVAGFSTAAALIIPNLYRELAGFVAQLPEYVRTLSERYGARFQNARLEDWPIDVMSIVDNFVASVERILSGAGQGIVDLTKRVGVWLSILLLTPIVGYNLLKDLPAIQKNILKLLPHRLESEVLDLLAEMDVLIGRYVRGQITVALIVGGLTSVALAALGLPYGILIGALAGLMNLVPIVGYWISLILALLVALSTDDALRMSLSVTAVFFTIQIIEQNLISPRIVGEQTGLHPVAVLLSLLVFASLMGLAGALLAIPIVLFIRVFFRRYLARRLREAAFPPI